MAADITYLPSNVAAIIIDNGLFALRYKATEQSLM
jgi:hypothetical protein